MLGEYCYPDVLIAESGMVDAKGGELFVNQLNRRLKCAA